VNPRDVQRGYADLAKLRSAAEAWQPVAERLAVVEGSSQLTVAQVRAQARRAMRQHQTERCLVVVDYLQLWAKVAEDLRGNFSVRERVDMLGGLLRELALGLRSPVLALASQNRSAGNYGNGKGSAALDSLKESGDLEYAADVVLFLTEAQERMATPPARAVELTVAKHRHGETGKGGVDLSAGSGHHMGSAYGGHPEVSEGWAARRHARTVCPGPRRRCRRLTVSTRGEKEHRWTP
jgi:replicative DNA helicase